MKIEWCMIAEIAVETPPKQKVKFLGLFLTCFWPILDAFVVGVTLCDMIWKPYKPRALKALLRNILMKMEQSNVDVTAVATHTRAEIEGVRLVIGIFVTNLGRYCGRGATL